MMQFTPVGILPKDYKHFDLLCQKGYMSYHLEHCTDKEGKPYSNVVWSLVADEEPVLDKKGRPRTSMSKHLHFCILLDYIAFKGEQYAQQLGLSDRIPNEQAVNVAIGLRDSLHFSNGADLALDRRKVHVGNTLALAEEMRNSGARKYNTVSQENAHHPKTIPKDALPDF